MISECRIVVGETAFELCFVRISSCDSVVEIETRCRIVTEIYVDLTESRDRLDILGIGLEVGEEYISRSTIASELIECESGELVYFAIVGSLREDLCCDDINRPIRSLTIEFGSNEEVAILIVRRYLDGFRYSFLQVEYPSTRSGISLDHDNTVMYP